MSSRRRTRAVTVLAALLLAAAALPAVELVAGATRFGTGKLANPCHARTFGGGGLDGVIQQTVLDGLDGAACRLGTTREALVLSLGSAGSLPPRRWDRHTIDVAVRSGMLAAVNHHHAEHHLGFRPSELRVPVPSKIFVRPLGCFLTARTSGRNRRDARPSLLTRDFCAAYFPACLARGG